MPAGRCKSLVILLLFFLFSLFASSGIFAESSAPPVLTSESAVLMDAKTGQVLFEKNMHQQQYPASITKIVTGIIALEKGRVEDTLEMSREAVFSIERNSAHIALDVNEEITLMQALYALAISSANDAANGIAEYISGDAARFAQLMNETAVESGAMNTNFVNANGLHDANHFTTAYDMASIMMQAVKSPLFLEIFSESRYEIPPTNLQPEIRYLNSKNDLLNGVHQYEGIIASKSGWTPQAKHTLVTAAKRGNRELIVVVLKSQSADNKYADTVKLLDYGFNAFSDVRFNIADLVAGISESGLNNTDSLTVNPSGDIVRLLHNNLAVEDIEKTFTRLNHADSGTIQLQLSLNIKQANEFMYENLGDTSITLNVETAVAGKQSPIVNMRKIAYYFAGFGILLFIVRLLRRRRKRGQFVNVQPYRYREL
ncbi:MAG: D-alanyl-D-alanine carboxypeptidase family protein [Bacillota bacterium]|nr:D-alanyl-D-alanine carboxypeptidase family protein [Bacillota bacterium]MDW7684484.1 D-alanyl-D-alanine carboxypeptidase family protein [Bacillota bacterium]